MRWGVQGGVTRHVLEVTVQHATDLPVNESFKGADSARCGQIQAQRIMLVSVLCYQIQRMHYRLRYRP